MRNDINLKVSPPNKKLGEPPESRSYRPPLHPAGAGSQTGKKKQVEPDQLGVLDKVLEWEAKHKK